MCVKRGILYLRVRGICGVCVCVCVGVCVCERGILPVRGVFVCERGIAPGERGICV